MIKIASIIVVLGVVLCFYNCGNNSKSSNVSDKDSTQNKKKDSTANIRTKTRNVFYSLPSPLETAALIKKTGIEYNEEVLNPISNLSNYSTNLKMALNLGIYGADLSYASLFEQKQTTINYMATVKKLANSLGILSAIKKNDLKRIEDNINNKDKIVKIISETFFNSDAYLKENNRPEIAAMIVVGGWVESLYIALQASKKSVTANKALVERIMDQRLSLLTVISLMESYKQNPDIEQLLTEMFELEKIYNKMIKTEVFAVKDKKTGQNIMKTKNIIIASPEVFSVLYDKVVKIRTNYIK